MENIAFKRAKSSATTSESLHPEFITEYADTSKFPEGFHKPEDGYEILPEDQFKVELNKNASLHQEFLDNKKRLEESRMKALEAETLAEVRQERQDKREYDEFIKWKQMKTKRK